MYETSIFLCLSIHLRYWPQPWSKQHSWGASRKSNLSQLRSRLPTPLTPWVETNLVQRKTSDPVAHWLIAATSNQTVYSNKLQHNIFIVPGLILSHPKSMMYSYSEHHFSPSIYHVQLPLNSVEHALSYPPIPVRQMMTLITASILRQEIQGAGRGNKGKVCYIILCPLRARSIRNVHMLHKSRVTFYIYCI